MTAERYAARLLRATRALAMLPRLSCYALPRPGIWLSRRGREGQVSQRRHQARKTMHLDCEVAASQRWVAFDSICCADSYSSLRAPPGHRHRPSSCVRPRLTPASACTYAEHGNETYRNHCNRQEANSVTRSGDFRQAQGDDRKHYVYAQRTRSHNNPLSDAHVPRHSHHPGSTCC
jgi:hypothetical protein